MIRRQKDKMPAHDIVGLVRSKAKSKDLGVTAREFDDGEKRG